MKKSIRKIHINNEEWHYISGYGAAKIYPPNSKIPMPFKRNNIIDDWHPIKDDKPYPHNGVIPSFVKQYIIDNLLEQRLKEGIR